jgi:hypothetical protein
VRDGVPVPVPEGVLDAVIVVEAVPELLGVALGVVDAVPVPVLLGVALGVVEGVPVPDWLGVLDAVPLLDRLAVDVTDGQPYTSRPSAS